MFQGGRQIRTQVFQIAAFGIRRFISPENAHDLTVGAEGSAAVDQICQHFLGLGILEGHRNTGLVIDFKVAEGMNPEFFARCSLFQRMPEVIQFPSDLLIGQRFEHIAARMQIKCLACVVSVSGREYNIHLRTHQLHLAGKFNTVQVTKIDIKEGNLNIACLHFIQSLRAAPAADNLSVRFYTFQNGYDMIKRNFLIIYRKNFHNIHLILFSTIIGHK